MKLEVAFLPRLLADVEENVCLVIDALRASSSIVTLLAHGSRDITVAASPAEAHRMARPAPRRYVLCGEVNGLAPPGFDYGNSPSEFSALDVRGWRVILSTMNGTKALRQVASAPLVLAGTLLNASAVTRALMAEAGSRGLNAALVCAGLERGKRLSLEDSFVAGALVDKALDEARRRGTALELTDDAVAAHRLYRSYRGSAPAAFRRAEHGRLLIALGLGHDLKFCAQVDRFDVVPRLIRDRAGRLILVAEKMQNTPRVL
jgi:2-phosphosulfolactate phosphatase